MTEPDKPGILDRLRMRFGWFDHVMRAQERYQNSKGDFFAAGITYFTVFALFPLLMVGFAVAGFTLARMPEVLDQIERWIKSTVSGQFGDQLVTLMNNAIDARTSLGVIGLATAAWAGLGFIANLREALSEMWGDQRREPAGFVKSKLSDLVALLSAFGALLVTIALTALADPSLMGRVLDWVGIGELPGLGLALGGVSLLLSLGVSWLLFTWMIARLPRETVSLRSAARAGLLAAVAFEIFKQVAALYLSSVMGGPAGSTFGPVLGLMVFAYVTARLILFATSWAATSEENMRNAPVPVPGPAEITTRVQVRGGLGIGAGITAAALGLVAALGLSRSRRD
ncbi:MAG: inner membrane protein YhjD [Mycobacterium sp.]